MVDVRVALSEENDRLIEENARLRAALETIGRMKVMPDDVMNRTTLVAAQQIARAALEGKQ